MLSIRNYNRTGERFWNEGEYSQYDTENDPLRFPTVLYSDPPYASQENNNKVYAHPSDAQQRHLYQRKPIDCGSIKILSNNISHLAYQKCRTLAVLNGPGGIGYAGSDRNLQAGSPLQNVVDISYPGWTNGLERDRYKQIAWSQYSSRRLGPFFSVLDRKFVYDATSTNTNLANNASCIRKMLLVISAYKLKAPLIPIANEDQLTIHVVVTSDGSNPANPAAAIIPLSAEQRAWVKEADGSVGDIEAAAPYQLNTPTIVLEKQGRPAYSLNVDGNSFPFNNYDNFSGDIKIFIPIDCIGNVNRSNASYNSVELFQYYVHVGWLAGSATHSITNITLLEVRDPGSAEANDEP